MRTLSLAVALLALTSAASAQLYSLTVRNEKVLKRHRSSLIPIHGRQAIVVELYQGVRLTPEGGFLWDAHGEASFFTAKLSDPDAVPYRIRDGKAVPRNRRSLLILAGEEIERIDHFLPEESFLSLSQEHRRRRQHVATLESLRDEHDKGSPQWKAAQVKIATAVERLADWLDASGYPDAADDVRKEAAVSRARIGEEASSLRLAGALASIQAVEVPEDLIAASQEVTEGKVAFRVVDSRHFRMVAQDSVPAHRLEQLLRFAERTIDDYRSSHIDPYVESGWTDKIPERRIQEFFLGPVEQEWFSGFLPVYYHHGWGRHADKKQLANGIQVHRPGETHFLDYWRVRDSLPLEGVVAHQIGHVIAEYQYLGCVSEVSGDWLREGMGFYIAMHHLGRNDVSCKQEAPASRYGGGTAERVEEEVSAQSGLRQAFLERALHCTRPLDSLLMAELYELSDGDQAKSWAVIEWLLTTQGKNGQHWLEAVGRLSWRRSTFLAELRRHSEHIYAIEEGEDVFRHMEGEWRAWAEKAAGRLPTK